MAGRQKSTEIRAMEVETDSSRAILTLTLVPTPPEEIAADILHAVPIVHEWRGRRGEACYGVVFNVIVKQPKHKLVRQALETAYVSEPNLQQALTGLRAEVQLRDLGAGVTATSELGVSKRPWWKLW